MTNEPILQIQQRALETFLHDLPRLWLERPGQWVAYQGDRQVGFAREKYEMYQQCLQAGLQRDEFTVFCIEPQETEIVFGPLGLD
jgi:hypothetical protein